MAPSLSTHFLINFCVFAGESCLTEKALAAHNEAVTDADGDALLEDGQSDAESYVSRWTNCTNTTFARLDRYANSNSALHKEVSFMGAILSREMWGDD